MVRTRGLVVTTSSVALVASFLLGLPQAQAKDLAPQPATSASPEVAQASATPQGTQHRSTQASQPRAVYLGGGTCPRSVPTGTVRLDGPGGTKITARVTEKGSTRIFTVISGSGYIGQNVVRPQDVSGELRLRNGDLTGEVVIDLPQHAKLTRTWAQRVTVSARPAGCGWASTVTLKARGSGASVDMRGPLTDRGSYFLRGGGVVGISGTRVPVSGYLRATPPGRSATTRWALSGSTSRAVRIPGAVLQGIRVQVSSGRALAHGAASLRLADPALSAPAQLEISGARTWTARVDGSDGSRWEVPGTDRVVVRTDEVKGSVGMRLGRPVWALSAPGSTRIGAMNYSVEVGFHGNRTYTIRARAAAGPFLSRPGIRVFLGLPTTLTVGPKGITGALSVVTQGEDLLNMPTVWRGSTDYILRPVPGRGWTFGTYISHALRAGKGTIRLTGPVSPSGAVRLLGSGALEVSGTLVPVRGYYNRTSFSDGTQPVWAMAGYPGQTKGKRIPLDGGAGFVGGIIEFHGTGSQDSSTIAASTSSRSLTPRSGTPGKPGSVTATVTGTSSVKITWTAASSNGYPPIIDYMAQTTKGIVVCGTSGLSCTVNELAPGSYAFQVRAENILGWGGWSAASNTVTVGGSSPSPSPTPTTSPTASPSPTSSPTPTPTATPTPTPTPSPSDPTDPPTVGMTGTTTVQLSDLDDDTFYLPVTYSYTDPNNWTATAAGTTPSNLYNPFTGLEIPETDFSGTITDADGTQTWDVSIAMQEWMDMAMGVDYKGAFTISNTCPLASADECPSASGIFIGGTSAMIFDDTAIPQIAATGAFLTDLSWARWDATATTPVTFLGITMTNPDVTVWRGQRNDTNPLLVLPDLSDLNGNGMNVEFCADFTVDVPYVDTLNTYGCAEWSSSGQVMGQVNTGGSVATGDYNGVTVNGTTLTGFATNGIDATETIYLNGVEIEAEKGQNYLTAQIDIPGNAMHDFGTGSSSDTLITADGWFDDEGNFFIEGFIPVNLKGGGFTLEEITVSVSREKEDDQETFDLLFDAESDVAINGNHFPLDVYIGYEKAGDTTITVGMSATGTQSTQPDGTMDFVNLVPSGDFEPENGSIVDGSFDGKLPPNIPNDGGFERSTNPGDVVVNGSFDDSMGQNSLPYGDFEDGTFGNILNNGDFEDQNVLVNGGFEENGGSLVGWITSSSAFTSSVVAGTASSPSGPEDQGDYVAVVSNNSASNNSTGGLMQIVPNPFTGSEITVTAWVMSNTSNTVPFHIQLSSNEGLDYSCNSGVSIKGATVNAAPGTWTQASVTGTIGNGCFAVQATLVPENSGTSVQVDSVEMSVPDISQANSVVSATRPSIIAPFDSLSTTPIMSGYSSGVSIATDYPGTLRTDGEQSWMLYSNTTGYTYGDFDVTYKLMFPSGSGDTREIADFGFWLDGNYSTMNGYCFRLQTANGDGGFIKCNKTTKSSISGATAAPDVTHDHWYQVRLTSVSGYVTAYVVDLTNNNSLFFTQTIPLNLGDVDESTDVGLFGQVPDGVKSSTGIRWDDIEFASLQGQFGWESRVYAPSQVWLGGGAHSGVGRASLYSSSGASVPFEYSTGETPAQNSVYTYSTWLRAASGTVNGSISLSGIGGTTETASTSFSVGTTWTEVAVTLQMTQADHTDVRPRITVGTTNAELQVDDQVLQQVPWYSNTGSSIIQVTTDDTHSGMNSLEITNPSNTAPSNAVYQFSQLPAPGSVYTASAWVASPAGVSGQLVIYEQGGTTSQSFTGTGTWQQVTVTRTMLGGSYLPALIINVNSGFGGDALYVDDASVVVSKMNSSEIGYVGSPSAPAGWTSSTDVLPTNSAPTSVRRTKPQSSTSIAAPASVSASASGSGVTVTWAPAVSMYPMAYYLVRTTSGGLVCQTAATTCVVSGLSAGRYAFQVQAVNMYLQSSPWSTASNTVAVYQNVAPVVVDDPQLARSAPGALVMQPGPGGTEIDSYTVTPDTAPAVGSTWQMSLWLASSTANNSQPVTVTFSAGSNTTSTTVDLPSAANQYTNATLSLPIASAATSFTVQISYTDASGASPIYLDDVSVTEVGLTPVDDWQTYAPGGFVAVQGVDDSSNAASGDGFLLLDNTGNQAAGIYLDDDTYRPKAGTAHEMYLWVKTPSGTVNGLTAWLRTFDDSGNTLDSYQYSFNSTSTWQPVFLSLPIKNTNAVGIRTEIDIPAGATVYVDNVESRDVNYWAAVQPSTGVASITIVDNADDSDGPANGQNFLRFSTSGAGGGMGDTITSDINGDAIDILPGSSYKLEAYVRSTNGSPINGTMSLAAANSGTTTDSASMAFTATSTWSPVELMLDATQTGNTLIPRITLGGAGLLDVDELTLIPVVIEQADPWSASGSGVTWQVLDDPPNAYDSSYGVMEFSVATGGTGVKHGATQSTSVGDQLSATAFVRTADDSVSGTFQVTSTGGTQETWSQSFTANGEWQAVSVPITVGQAGHTGFTVSVLLNTTGTTLYLDQVALETNPWTPNTGAQQSIVFNGASAQSGSGYLHLQATGSGSGSTYLDMPASSDIGGTYAAGTTWIVTTYIRSSTSNAMATGQVSLGLAGGTSQSQPYSVGDEWTAVPVSFTVGSSAVNSLRVQVAVNGANGPVDVDSVTISDGTPPPDGITTPLPHPQSGWVYLWDNAFGIPGHHLWAISAQVDFVSGLPGLGIASTVYQDPTKLPNVMSGTDWIQGNMAFNASESDPCFMYEFASDGGNSGVSLGQGVFTANDFSINFAPRGCQVGPDTLPKGASLSFDGELGDGQVSFAIAIAEGDDGPEFTEDIGITDITIGGFDFKEMELSIYLTATDDSITFAGDMVTPMGNFNGTYDLSANESGLVMDGSVQLTDWGWAGGGFDVEEFDYDMSMTVPFGADQCGSFSEDASGLMDMAKKTSLSFTGKIAMDCGKLQVLQMDYDYKHGSVTEVFELDYDASTGVLAGEVEFDFDRSTSWKFFFHRYNRHPKFSITLAYSMNVDKPSTAEATLTGDISVSGGDGSLSCQLVIGSGTDWADDQCSLHVHISIGGGHTFNASW